MSLVHWRIHVIAITVDVLPYLRPPALLKKWSSEVRIRTLILRARGTQYSRLRQTKRRIKLRHMIRKLCTLPCEGRVVITMKKGFAVTEGEIIVRYRTCRTTIEKHVRKIEAYASRTAEKYAESDYGLRFIIRRGETTTVWLH